MNVVDKKYANPSSPADYKAERDLEWNIPLGDTLVELTLRGSGTLTVGAADATSLQTGGMERLLREVKVVADWKARDGLDTALRSYTQKGVNDGVAGRTCAFAGRMLALESLVDMGTPVVKTDPGLTQAAHAVEIEWPIRFWMPRGPRPLATLLNTNLLNSLKLQVKVGIQDTTAAGDDTDILVTDAATTVVGALTWELFGRALKKADKAKRFDVRRVRSKSEFLGVSDEQYVKLGEKNFYSRVLALCLDDDVLSDARITDMWVRVNKDSNKLSSTWKALKGIAKQKYHLAAALSGMNVIDFGGLWNTMGASDVDLVCKVPAGAVVTADKVLLAVEDVILAGKMGKGTGHARKARRLKY